jgi:hypothetical protein
MTLLIHLLRTHVRRLRWFIVLWLALVVVGTAMNAAQPRLAYDARLSAMVGLAASLLAFAVNVGAVVLVAAIVHMDPAVGTDAFWMTRPIPRETLALAKILLASALVVLMPAAAFAATWAALHIRAAEVARASIETMLWGLVWVMILTAMSALTKNFARFALLAGAALGAVALAFATLIAVARFGTPAPIIDRPLPQPVDPTPLVAAEVVVLAAALAVIVLQYRTRRRRLSVPVGVAGLVLAFFTLGRWPIPVLAATWQVPAWAGRGDAPQLRARAAEMRFDQNASAQPEDAWRTGRVELELDGVEPGWEAKASLLAASVTLTDGRVIRSGGNGYLVSIGRPGTRESAASIVARQALGVERTLGVYPPFAESNAIVMQARARDVEALDGATGDYRGRFAVTVSKWETVGTLPLSPGATFQDDSYRFTILESVIQPGRVIVRAHESRLTSWFDRAPRRSYELYLRNASRSEAIPGGVAELSGDGPFSSLFGISIARQQESVDRGAEARFPSWWGQPENVSPIPRDWFAGAELVFVRVTEAAVLERTLAIHGVTIVAR